MDWELVVGVLDVVGSLSDSLDDVCWEVDDSWLSVSFRATQGFESKTPAPLQ